ncbi:MAG: tetratricopeptide repeat protein [Candidatus Riflebacteria bacterium]|nr:tetratricopeptide repeat protein [Candidatus Riflebacteria bacterium]
MKRLYKLFLILILLANSYCVLAKGKMATQSVPIAKEGEQEVLLKNEVLTFLSENNCRKAGEGYLFLAKHYIELENSDKALEVLKTLVRAENIEPQYKWDGELLAAEIYEKDKNYEKAIKELDRLISWNPDRKWFVKAKVARAKVLGRGMSKIDDLFKAYQKYFQKFPELPEFEEMHYLMGFERGYDLEIANTGFLAWEEITFFHEKDAADLAALNRAIFYAYDLQEPEKGLKILWEIQRPFDNEAAINSLFVAGSISQYHIPNPDFKVISENYEEFIRKTENLSGYRTAHLLLGSLLVDSTKDYKAAIDVFSELATVPARLIATPSISLKKRREQEIEDLEWAKQGLKMAGYAAEYKLKDLDRARTLYEKATEIETERLKKAGGETDYWLPIALLRTEPKISPAESLFEQAYEKYRSRDIIAAVSIFESFVASYPNHELCREALFRLAFITENDLKDLDKAIDLYQQCITKAVPHKSSWNLDKLIDWGRIDEVRYRLGNLKLIHRKDPLGAVKDFEDLLSMHPDSSWGEQSLKDTITIQKNDLQDDAAAQKSMIRYVELFPDNKSAQEYRKELYSKLIKQDQPEKALEMLRDYLDHESPDEDDFLKLKKEWRDLAFKIREKDIRRKLEKAAPFDKAVLYSDLIPVLSLATSSAPLEDYVKEVESADLDDEIRWKIIYRIAIEMYNDFPDKSAAIFQKLSETSSGTMRLTCFLTLGNLAYRIEKSVDKSVKYYEASASMTDPLDPLLEAPEYRLGRLYLVQGEGIKAVEKLTEFARRFPKSRYLAKAWYTMGLAYMAMHQPQTARSFLMRASRLSPALADKIRETLDNLSKAENPDQWIANRSGKRKIEREKKLKEKENATQTAKIEAGKPETKETNEVKKEKATEKNETTASEAAVLLAGLSSEDLEKRFVEANSEPKPDGDKIVPILIAALKTKVNPKFSKKALLHYISWRFFRQPSLESFAGEAQEILTARNYPPDYSELLFRLAQDQDRFLKNYEGANKSYFEYLSFFPDGKRALAVRERIPQVYELAKDKKNALRFYEKLIEDSGVPAESKVEACLRKAGVEEHDEKKQEAIKTLESALSYETKRKPEIYINLERLTDDFENIKRALESTGDENFRFAALKRMIRKAEKDDKYDEAVALLKKYKAEFIDPKAQVWLEKKFNDLGKRGEMSDIEDKLEKFPEDNETPKRLFQLAHMVEGVDDTKYRSQDLFYEITLVYPTSEFFKESKIRAENTKTIKNIDAIGDKLKEGTKEGEGDELLLERARLYESALKDSNHAQEDYEALLKLFPDSPRRDEAYLGLGEIVLKQEKDSEKARLLWEKGLSVTVDPKSREQLLERIDNLKLFRETIFSEKSEDHEKGEEVIFRIWRVDGNIEYALGLIMEALEKMETKPQKARLYYLAGRIFEETGNFSDAYAYFDRALRSYVHPRLRKDLVMYRMARLRRNQGMLEDAEKLFKSLTYRYPQSRYCRSAFYYLYKLEMERKNLAQAHYYINRLLEIRSLFPEHRKYLGDLEKKLTADLSIEKMKDLSKISQSGDSTFKYFEGKILENDIGDIDKAVAAYEEFLKTDPPISKARDVLLKMADLEEKKKDYVKAVYYLDSIRKSQKPAPEDLELVIRIGDIVEDRLSNQELSSLYYQTIEDDYRDVPNVRKFAQSKLERFEEKKLAKVEPSRAKKSAKREYTEEDEAIIDNMKDIKATLIEDKQDYTKAERELVALWEENPKSMATLEILKMLADLNMKQLMDPQKAGEYYEKWLSENPNDPASDDITMELFDLYMEKLKNGPKALVLLENWVRQNPTSPMIMEAEFKLALANEMLVRNFDEARRAYQRIIDTKRNEPIVHESYFRMGFVLREGFSDYDNAIKTWEEMNNLFYNNKFSPDAQYAIAYTYEVYKRDYTNARANYEKFLNLFPNSPLQNQVREALLRIQGKN